MRRTTVCGSEYEWRWGKAHCLIRNKITGEKWTPKKKEIRANYYDDGIHSFAAHLPGLVNEWIRKNVP